MFEQRLCFLEEVKKHKIVQTGYKNISCSERQEHFLMIFFNPGDSFAD
jgi:hypothetical protein